MAWTIRHQSANVAVSVSLSPVLIIFVVELSVQHSGIVVMNILHEVSRSDKFLTILHRDLKHKFIFYCHYYFQVVQTVQTKICYKVRVFSKFFFTNFLKVSAHRHDTTFHIVWCQFRHVHVTVTSHENTQRQHGGAACWHAGRHSRRRTTLKRAQLSNGADSSPAITSLQTSKNV